MLRNERIERERNFAINLPKMQERTHERMERMPTLLLMPGDTYIAWLSRQLIFRQWSLKLDLFNWPKHFPLYLNIIYNGISCNLIGYFLLILPSRMCSDLSSIIKCRFLATWKLLYYLKLKVKNAKITKKSFKIVRFWARLSIDLT